MQGLKMGWGGNICGGVGFGGGAELVEWDGLLMPTPDHRGWRERGFTVAVRLGSECTLCHQLGMETCAYISRDGFNTGHARRIEI